MELPEHIELDILNYLHLEFGEDPSDDESLKLEDLKYQGLHKIDGVECYCWSFSPLKEDTWATYERTNDMYCIGMRSVPKELREPTFSHIYLQIESDQKHQFKIPLAQDKEYKVISMEDDFTFTLPSGEDLRVYCEIYTTPDPAQVALTIELGENESYIKCAAGIEMRYSLGHGCELQVDVGNLEW